MRPMYRSFSPWLNQAAWALVQPEASFLDLTPHSLFPGFPLYPQSHPLNEGPMNSSRISVCLSNFIFLFQSGLQKRWFKPEQLDFPRDVETGKHLMKGAADIKLLSHTWGGRECVSVGVCDGLKPYLRESWLEDTSYISFRAWRGFKRLWAAALNFSSQLSPSWVTAGNWT